VNAPVTQAYVFASNPAGESVLCGTLASERTAGTFNYAEQWLSAPWAYPLDPVNLKLQSGPCTTRNSLKVLPVFSDAGPDDWGTRVLLAGHSRIPASELERLVATSGHGAGCLQFSLSRSRPKAEPLLASPEFLEVLENASRNIAQNQPVDPALLAMLIPATTVGGARPKITLQDGSRHWIAKFSKPDDLIDAPLVEYATLKLARHCAIVVPDTAIRRVADRHVFLTERFDREQGRRLHYISMHSLFNQERIRLYDNAFADPCSYAAFGRVLRSHARDWAADAEQLFRRIVFNVLVGNTDDHARNHGMVFDPALPGWRLSPAFDIVPTLSQAREHALGIGEQGRLRSLKNVASGAKAFGIDDVRATAIIDEIRAIVAHWQEAFEEVGVTPADIRILENIIGER